MKRICIYIIMSFIAFIDSYGQPVKELDIMVTAQKDSMLFYRLGFDKEICPVLDFEKTYKCYHFLKRMRAWERCGSPYSSGARTFSSRDEEYEQIIHWGGPWQYEYAEGDTNWKTFVPEFQKAYDAKHGQAYNEEKEKRELVSRLEAFSKQATYKPLFFRIIDKKYKGSVALYVDDLYGKSMMTNSKKLRKFLRNPSYKRLDKDMGAQMSIAIKMYQIWLENRSRITPEKMGLFVYRP